ncbi:50S ribosomal protein L29 [Buchnera aphidicola]|uniref:Large ribosomal subunit protein uL29 n=1 Tax=Buchnera aphidicola (Therioaphis trifolii) TaxID=1241884 RepID=A0A4D6YN56_9GAMM|nr:50S ribosomal protein L29 [Buchnera aphidicola]QCI27328.1 50S ribosomal protein L29 [Buchnera aphidicola (Therioaphis trifolii)]
MKLIKLHKKTIHDLNIELLNLLREKFSLKIQLSSGKLKKTHMLKKVRRNIAQIKTIITIKSRV